MLRFVYEYPYISGRQIAHIFGAADNQDSRFRLVRHRVTNLTRRGLLSQAGPLRQEPGEPSWRGLRLTNIGWDALVVYYRKAWEREAAEERKAIALEMQDRERRRRYRRMYKREGKAPREQKAEQFIWERAQT